MGASTKCKPGMAETVVRLELVLRKSTFPKQDVASERKTNDLNGFQDFYPIARTRILP